ncbi:hypothetical protein QJQ45_008685 [Haematococcus lacustris]|nr:hypothetical protein QJQ45_008685 [Haematococcus lacustris]
MVMTRSRKRLLEGEEAGVVQPAQPAIQQPQQEPQPQLVLEQPLPPPPLPVHPLHAVNMTEQLLAAYAADEAFASTVDQYDLDQHGLYRTKGKNQIVVPHCTDLKARILVEMHDAQFAGHVGITKTLERISRIFWWPRMRSEVRHYSDWPFFLSLAEFAVNNSWQESIQSTPFLVNTGQSPLTPALLELPGEVYCPSARKLSEWWQSNVKQARHFMEQAQQRQAYLANKGRRDVEFSPDQLVLLSTKNLRLKPGKAKKLLPRFIGPFRVLEHVGPVAVRLDLPPAMARMHPVFHVALLRPYTTVGVHQGEDGMEVAWQLRHEALRLKGSLTRAPEYKLYVIGPASVVDSQLKAACDAKDLALIAHYGPARRPPTILAASSSEGLGGAGLQGQGAELAHVAAGPARRPPTILATGSSEGQGGAGLQPQGAGLAHVAAGPAPGPPTILATGSSEGLGGAGLQGQGAGLAHVAAARVKANVDEAAEALRRQVRHLRLQLTRQRSTSVIMPTSKHATIAKLAVKHVKSPHHMRQLLSTAGLLAAGQGKGELRKDLPEGMPLVEEAVGTRWLSYARIAIYCCQHHAEIVHVLDVRIAATPAGAKGTPSHTNLLELQRLLTLSPDVMVQCAALAGLNRCFFQPYLLWGQAGSSRHFCQWHTRHDQEVALLQRVCAPPQEGQESAHPACEVFAVAQQLHLTTVSAWEVVQPIFLEARRYYCHRMAFLDLMPYRFAQLGDTDSTARQRAAWAVLGHFSCGGMDMFERPPSKELVGDLLRTYLLGVLSSRLEELLALLYKPAHITNAACETALKPLSSSGVEKMTPEQVAAHVKAHIEDLDTWVPHITRESLAESRVADRVAKRQRKEDKQAAAVAFFGKASPSLATAHPSPVAAATPSPTAGAATSTSVCKRGVGSITISLASVEARSACGQTMQQEEAKQYAADKATDKGRHLQAVALFRCKLASNKLPPTTSKLLKNQLQELWAVVGNGQPTVKPVRNMHMADWLDALAVHMSHVTN